MAPSKENALRLIQDAMQVGAEEIGEMTLLKKGMTNHSFLFTCGGKRYILRIPGEGTEMLIDRREEAEVYRAIQGRDICDDNLYIDPATGCKITAYLENARVCDPLDEEDVKRCMEKLRGFHNSSYKVGHRFNLFDQILFYESLRGQKSIYEDYLQVKERVFSLKEYIEAHVERETLTHIDAVPDNFLFVKDEKDAERLYLIDWEYAGMQDPHVDIAMFSIYAFYARDQIDSLMEIYFGGSVPKETRVKIYCYIAVCGLLWSNWCEYKRSLGVDFGDYSTHQYAYARDYYQVVIEELGGV